MQQPPAPSPLGPCLCPPRGKQGSHYPITVSPKGQCLAGDVHVAGQGRARRPGAWRGSLRGHGQQLDNLGGVSLRRDNAADRTASPHCHGSLTAGSWAEDQGYWRCWGAGRALAPVLAAARRLSRPRCIVPGPAPHKACIVTCPAVPARTPTSGHGACPQPAPRLRERESSWSGEKSLSSPFGSWRKGLFLHSGFCRSGFSAAS